MQLNNPELAWLSEVVLPTDLREEVERRFGPSGESLALLSGGRANLNILLRESRRVLRVYLRDPAAVSREATLLSVGRQHCRTPAVLAQGVDYLVLEYVNHQPLEDDAAAGAACGRALAELHGQVYDSAGSLDSTLALAQPYADFVDVMLEHLGACSQAGGADARPLLARVAVLIEHERGFIADLARRAVLLHGDFKPGNLHRADDQQLLVLDWEFAFAGPALMDIGQLLRWRPSLVFQRAFEMHYLADGGQLPPAWYRGSQLLDLVNLAGLLVKVHGGAARRVLAERISSTLGAAPR